MRFSRKEIGKLFILKWKDAYSAHGVSLSEMLKKGLILKTSIGWLAHIEKDFVSIIVEKDDIGDDLFDRTNIPIKWIVDKTEIED